MVHVRQLHAQGEVVLEFSGSLDVRSADQLAAVALQQPLALRLVIDISHASHVHDAALGRLVEALPVHRRSPISVKRSNSAPHPQSGMAGE